MHSLRGGPSYSYSYEQDLDPTEMQFLQGQALQESQQTSGQQVNQSYSQSYWQQNRVGLPGSGFGMIPEDSEMMSFQQGDFEQGFQRRCEVALQSWKMGDKLLDSQSGPLALSSNASSIDLKDFLSKRGDKTLRDLHKLAAQGDRNGIIDFMKQYGPNAPINELDTNGCTPLMYATMADSRLAIEMLLNFGAKREKTDSEGRTAVHYAAFFGKHRALKFLVTAASDWTSVDSFGRTPLHWSCISKSTQALSVLLKHSQVVMGTIDPCDHEGMTPLHCAAHFCRPRHIALLHEAGCDFKAVDCDQKTTLHWTAMNPDSSCVQVLVDLYPSLLNKQDEGGSTLLHYTAKLGATHLVTALLEVAGIDVDVKDGIERTALHWACVGNHSEIVQLLLGSNALDSCIDASGLTALHYCVRNKSVSSAEAFVGLEDMTHLPNYEGRTPSMEAAASDDPDVLEILLKHRAVVNAIDNKDPQGMSSLHLASECGSSRGVAALLAKGAQHNILDALQRTPVFLAAQNGHGNCIQALASRGCKLDLFDGEGQAPLHKAVMYNQLESVQVLAMNGADLDIKDPLGNTPLHMAAYGASNAILVTLLDQSANPNLQDVNGVSPAHFAAMEGHAESLSILVTHGAYMNFVDFSEERHTPVDYARLHSHVQCVEILTEAGGVSTEDIRTTAALAIQTVYRGYRARLLRSKLALKTRAAICLSKHVRGFIQRRKFAEMRNRHSAAIRIQALYRGYVERVRFQIQLSQFREGKHHCKLLENFSKLVEQGHERGILKTFDVGVDLSPERGGIEAVEVLEKERKIRFETSMKMRAIYQEKQKRWQQFRDAEKQRRIDKANVKEMNRLNNIIEESRARRAYTQAKFHQTLTVRSFHQAALVIQHAYRRMRLERGARTKLQRDQVAIVRRGREKAALVIQRAWRMHQQQKLYKEMHFMSIRAGPVISVDRRMESPPGVHSYERGISITGSPKRKIHQTLPSSFHVFRPLTRDLLQGPGVGFNPVKDPFTSRLSSQEEERRRLMRAHLVAPKAPSSHVRGRRAPVKQVTLPKLFTKPASNVEPLSTRTVQININLPEIIPPA